jgi:capsule polysaccharide export protein KpsE/RkpR
MSGAESNQSLAAPDPEVIEREVLDGRRVENARERQVERLYLIWDRRRIIGRIVACGVLVSILIAFLIPRSYTSTAQLMPPDGQSQSTSGLAMMMMAAMATKVGSRGLGSVAGDLFGLKSSGGLFIGILRSETAQDRIVQKFDLRKVYGKRRLVDARDKLDENTSISEDRKSGIITIKVTDHNAERSAAIANVYVDELNLLVVQLSTSSAHRERVFLEQRLKVVKVDLDDAAKELAQYSSKNSTLDMETEGKAMLDAAARVSGELIAAQSQLEGLRQIYTDNNARVRSLSARVAELRKQLEKIGGTEGAPAHSRQWMANVADPPSGQSGDPPGEADPPSAKAGSLPFPTIRGLPLLGAKWSDYYRRAKIQETVFELLTEQYELAKVQEAKETPSVKVLDPGKVPEKKSFPPRILIFVLGTILAIVFSFAWVVGAKNWEETYSSDPRKILAQQVFATLMTRALHVSRNGNAKPPEAAGED